MIKVRDMNIEEMQALIRRVGFGHLGCARDGRPYVVPMNYAYDSQDLYFFTTEGTKTEFIEANPQVYLQVEEVADASRWQSVMVTGQAELVSLPAEMERAMQLLTARNPTLTPAINETRIDAWGRPNNIRIYRLRPAVIDGRAATPDAAEPA
ncbi:MAG TPA: pyridoxamine 5'-phosphate oxidase family protein [Pyrinomonadaceae bacterium]|nr:pyridoxamine 5'-phosphate oxidase family protein [Pyrinomonadaceae bacterium]